MIIISILIAILIIGVLVFVHELGHFTMAKRAGMKVKEFGFGFPPRIWGIKKGETIYSINWIPLGGFVSILGEDGEDATNPRSFAAAKPGPRASVIVAGVVMNVFLAYVLLVFVSWLGIRLPLEGHTEIDRARDVYVSVGYVNDNSPADEAGLIYLDSIVSVQTRDGVLPINAIEDLGRITNAYRGQEITFDVIRNGKAFSIAMTPRMNPPEGQGAIGVGPIETGFFKYGFVESLGRGFTDAGDSVRLVFTGFLQIIKKIATEGTPGEGVAGPIGIVVLIKDVTVLGLAYLLWLAALLSANLAVINLLPIPPLDGGKLFFIIIEKIKGSPVSKKIEGTFGFIGMAALLLLIIYVTIGDIGNLL